MQKQTKIALVLNKDLARCRGILRGILQYSHSKPDWVLHTVASLSPSRLDLLKRWSPDGIIAEIPSKEDEKTLSKLRVPAVSVSNIFSGSRFPQVIADQTAIGQAVARHLLDRGLRNFGYLGLPVRQDTDLQYRGFAGAVKEAGGYLHTPPPIPVSAMADWASLDQKMSEWLLSVPKPCGLMLWDDDWGMWITQLCRLSNVRVPDDAALVGVNDDTLNCELAEPALSAVGIPLQQIGHAAAEMLDEMLGGGKPTGPRYIPHLTITTRPSSDILTMPDADLVAAVRYIRSMAHTKIGVEDILAAVPVSRRILERKFRKFLDRTPLQEIRRTQVDLAKRLLAQTDAPLKDIGARIGFDNVYHLCRTFKQQTGLTPMQYRRQFRVR